ncbi:beta strand repeat-containing protein, partial [Helicobacter pullorum]|uniref:beta strand repeat-containing protein n=1 Tax=Helicobacter pullorum TaxID=35818 RepID=UPI000AD1E4E0
KALNNQSLENPKNAKGLDSKSKLESQNPNKIQTTKIQDSKIELDSKIQLESNSPKLKDSKVSKTSKDSMKLESSPKLDSKTCQKSNKESESKQPKKIQRAKTCDSKKPTKSKKSKLKSFIRTIPISIALASALSSQAVAGWSVIGGGNVNNVGTITSNITLGDTIIEATANGSYTDIVIGSNVTLTRNDFTASDNNIIRVVEADGGKVTNLGTLRTYSRKRVLHMQGRHMEAFINQGTINNQYWTFYMKSGSSLGSLINEGGTIINSNTGSDGVMIRLENASSIGQITIDGGSIQSGRGFISLANASTIDNITISSNANVENTSSGRTSIDLSGGSVTGTISVEDTASLKSNINISGNNRIGGGIIIGGGSDSPTFSGNITLNNGSILGQGIQVKSGTMTSEVSLAGRSSISKILIDGSNSSGTNGTPKLAGNITMDGTSAIANGITIANGGTLDGNINTKNSSSIGGIVVDNGTIVGDIIASGTSRLNGITIVNGGEMRGNIEALWVNGSDGHTMNLGNIDIQSRLQGGITLANAATIESLSLSNGGTITNAVSIGASGSLDHISILKTITLNGASGINSLVVGSSSDNEGTINSITLGGNSSIGSINVAEKGTIANLEIGNASQAGSIGSITNAGKLQNITLNNTSTITNGITNNSGGTISNIALNGASTITNGITNASGGTISNITLASSNTIHSGITNNGVITEINHNVAGVENAVTNNADGSISRLIVSQGTIEYNGDGAITEELSVKNGATLSMNNGSGTITMNGAVGSKLYLESGSTFKGSLKNTGNINDWTNVSNIEGSFINDTNANIGILKAGQITGTLLNKGNIGELTIDNVVGTLSNESEITTLSVQNRVANGILNSGNIQTLTLENSANLGSVGVSNSGVITSLNNHKAGMQITNTQGIGTLAVDANTTYAGNGSITNALDIDRVQTQFTISNNNNGVMNTLTLAENANTANSVKTITNEGTIIGNLINDLTSTNWTFGVLQGNFTNNGNLTAFNTGSITGILTNGNNGIINTLNTSKVGGSIANNGNLVNLIVDSNKTLTGNGSITNSLVVQDNRGNGYTLTIGSGGTGNLNFKATNGTIDNAGTINGNITNVSGSTIADFTNSGNMVGNITNSAGSTITIFENIGTITGNIDNTGVITDFDNQGIINGTLTNNGNIGDFTNSGSIKEFNNQKFIAFYENNGIIGKFNNTGTIYGVSNSKVITGDLGNNIAALKNTGTITGNVNLTGTCPSGGCPDDYDETLASFINNEGTIGGSIANNSGHTLTSILNDSSGTIQNGITNNGSITNITNEGKINANGITNSSQIGMIDNKGLITGNLTNNTTSSIITTINTGSITGSIANSGEITTLNVTG